jgi:hypothetical protein
LWIVDTETVQLKHQSYILTDAHNRFANCAEVLKLTARLMHGINNIKLKHHLQAIQCTNGHFGKFLVFYSSVATTQPTYLSKIITHSDVCFALGPWDIFL